MDFQWTGSDGCLGLARNPILTWAASIHDAELRPDETSSKDANRAPVLTEFLEFPGRDGEAVTYNLTQQVSASCIDASLEAFKKTTGLLCMSTRSCLSCKSQLRLLTSFDARSGSKSCIFVAWVSVQPPQERLKQFGNLLPSRWNFSMESLQPSCRNAGPDQSAPSAPIKPRFVQHFASRLSKARMCFQSAGNFQPPGPQAPSKRFQGAMRHLPGLSNLRCPSRYAPQNYELIPWMDGKSISHRLRKPGMMIPLQMATNVMVSKWCWILSIHNMSALVAILPKAELRDPQAKNLYHGELVLPQVSSLHRQICAYWFIAMR